MLIQRRQSCLIGVRDPCSPCPDCLVNVLRAEPILFRYGFETGLRVRRCGLSVGGLGALALLIFAARDVSTEAFSSAARSPRWTTTTFTKFSDFSSNDGTGVRPSHGESST